jgi:hypothetical protein
MSFDLQYSCTVAHRCGRLMLHEGVFVECCTATQRFLKPGISSKVQITVQLVHHSGEWMNVQIEEVHKDKLLNHDNVRVCTAVSMLQGTDSLADKLPKISCPGVSSCMFCHVYLQ